MGRRFALAPTTDEGLASERFGSTGRGVDLQVKAGPLDSVLLQLIVLRTL